MQNFIYKSFIFFSFVVLLCTSLHAQRLVVATRDANDPFRGRLYLIDISTCTDSELVASTYLSEYFDIAVCPGNPDIIYGVQMGGHVDQIDIKTGKVTNLSPTISDPGAGALNSLLCDGKGHLLSADAKSGNFYQFDLGTNQWSLLGNMGSYNSSGDLTYFNGQLYLSTISNQLITINLSPFSVQLQSTLSVQNVWGVNTVAVPTGCGLTYKMVASATSSLYYVDPATGNCTPACIGVTPNYEWINGAASLSESNIVSPPNLTSVSPQPVCLGANVTLVLHGLHPYKYSWTPGNYTDSVLTIPASNSTYTITGTDSKGCTATTTVKVIANALPSAKPSAIDGKCNLPNSGSANANASGGTGPYTYSWAGGSGGINAVITNLAPGGYTVTVTDKNGCTNTGTAVVGQTANLNLQISNPAPVCEGNSATIITTVNGTAPYNYSWSTAASGSSITVTPASTTSYIVTVSDAGGCTGTQTATVIVNPVPAADFASVNVCAGTGTKFTDASTISGGGTVADSLWDFGDNATSTSLNPIHTYQPGNYKVILWVTGKNGCKDSVSHIIAVYPSPLAAFTANEVCKGKTSVFSNQSNGASNYSWNFGDNPAGTSTTANPTYIYNNAGTYTVTLSVSTGFNCTATATSTTMVDPLPIPLFSSTPVCEGGLTTFTDQSTVPGGSIKGWNWNLGDVPAATSNVKNPVHTYKAGAYAAWLVVTTDKGCKDSIKDSAKVNPVPVPDFSAPAKGCSPVCIHFSDKTSISSPDKIVSWLWDFGDQSAADNSQNPTHCYTTPGVYNAVLKVTSGHDCSASKKIDSIAIVYDKPQADFIPEPGTVGTLDPTIQFKDASSGNPVSWHWDFGSTPKDTSNLQNPSFTYPNDVNTSASYTVKLKIVNQYGCPDSTSKPVHVIPDWNFYVPNTFTPNGDGINDLFFGTGTGITEKEMWIYDRWGNEIFHTNDLHGGWDGKVQGGYSNLTAQIDTYVWLIKIKEVLGNYHKYVGHVNIVK